METDQKNGKRYKITIDINAKYQKIANCEHNFFKVYFRFQYFSSKAIKFSFCLATAIAPSRPVGRNITSKNISLLRWIHTLFFAIIFFLSKFQFIPFLI